jgi:hypothetical protein
MANKKDQSQINPEGQMSETSPNPHGESKVLKMPINTDQRNATGGRNVPQIPNTVGGQLNPGVVHEFQGRVLTREGAEIQPDSAKRMGESKPARAPKPGKTVSMLGRKKKDA